MIHAHRIELYAQQEHDAWVAARLTINLGMTEPMTAHELKRRCPMALPDREMGVRDAREYVVPHNLYRAKLTVLMRAKLRGNLDLV